MNQNNISGEWDASLSRTSQPINNDPQFLRSASLGEIFITHNSIITFFVVIVAALIMYYGFLRIREEIVKQLTL